MSISITITNAGPAHPLSCSELGQRGTSVELTIDQAWELAQMCKRLSYSTLRENAVDDEAAYTMREVLDALLAGLAAVGIAPR